MEYHTTLTIRDGEIADRFRTIRDEHEMSTDGLLEKLLDDWERSE